MYRLGNAEAAGWHATIDSDASSDAVKDPNWTAFVTARQLNAAKTASLGVAVPGKKAAELTGEKSHALDGIASYYWQDQMTASGEVFNKREMTAAHKTLPLGTKVKVTNLTNGRSAILRINDRGPYSPGRVIDVSEAAADVLGMRERGLAPVRVDVVSN